MIKVKKYFYALFFIGTTFILSKQFLKLINNIEYQEILASRSLVLEEDRDLEDVYYTANDFSIFRSS